MAKEEKISGLASKLVQILFVLDGKIVEKEALSTELGSLSDIIFEKVTILSNKSKKERKSNKLF